MANQSESLISPVSREVWETVVADMRKPGVLSENGLAALERLDRDIKMGWTLADIWQQALARVGITVYDILPELDMLEAESPDGTEDD